MTVGGKATGEHNAAQSRAGGRALKKIAWLIGVVSLILSIGGGLLFYANRPVVGDAGVPADVINAIMALGYSIVGLLILNYRPDHGIGWLFLGVALASATGAFARQYAVYGLLVAALPGAGWMAWLQSWIFNLVFPAPVVLLCLLFPNGRLPSRRWWVLVWLGVLSSMTLIGGELIRPGSLVVYIASNSVDLGVRNPTGVSGWADFSLALNGGWLLALFLLPAALFAPVWRYRQAGRTERQQLKWFVYSAGIALLLLPVAFANSGPAGEAILAALLLIPPTATAIAILRYQLYDIDVIIKRTLLYGVLSAILAAVYFATVLLLQAIFVSTSGQQSAVAVVISTLLIAALFSPLRRRVQDLIDRRFYRQKYDAQQVLNQFAQTARDEVSLEALTAELVRVVEEAMRPASISLWLKTWEQTAGPTKGGIS